RPRPCAATGAAQMRTLIYKRTHPGDPVELGRFGIWDCMGRVRDFDFYAVIGIGGIGAEARSYGIDGKLNWIGIGPRKAPSRFGRGRPLVRFRHFRYFGEDGPDLRTVAPTLAKRMYSKYAPRFVLDSFRHGEAGDIARLLTLADDAPPSRTR